MTSPTELGQLKFASNISLREGTPHFHSVKRNIFRVWRSFVGFCFLGSGFWQPWPSPISSQKVCLSGWSRLVHQLIPSTFFDFFLFLIIFLHMFLEALSAFRVLNLLHVYNHSLGRHLSRNLFVYNNGNSMLDDMVDSSSVAMVAFVGKCFVNSAHSFDVYNVMFLVESHVCGQRNNSMFSKKPREHRAGAARLYVGHFGKLLEDGIPA